MDSSGQPQVTDGHIGMAGINPVSLQFLFICWACIAGVDILSLIHSFNCYIEIPKYPCRGSSLKAPQKHFGGGGAEAK